MSDRWDTFDRIWAKGMNGKMRMRLMEKVKIRGLEPNEDNCRDYWMGYIRHYKDAWTGEDFHINPRKNKNIMKKLKRNRSAAERRTGSKRSPHHVGRRNNSKNSKIRRRK